MTTLAHSPRVRTRSQASVVPTVEERETAVTRSPRVQAGTPAAAEPTAEALALQSTLREIRLLREEQQQMQAQYAASLHQRDEELRQLREDLRSREISQLSLSHNGEIAVGARVRAESRMLFPGEVSAVKLKPDTFDGSAPFREFFLQFELISRVNRWESEAKTAVLVSCLRGKARAVLESVQDLENLDFSELKSKLELRFGEGHPAQTYYSQFTNRKQRPWEDLSSLGADLERLSRLAYPECSHEVRDKIACAQFIAALSDGFVKRTLQLEGVISLRKAIERAMAIKVIQENSFPKRKEEKSPFYVKHERDKLEINAPNFKRGKDRNSSNKERNFGKRGDYMQKNKFQTNKFSKNKECWQCGAQGHFRSECPTKLNEGNAE